jgi:probable HAF family extracellular repeat protein
MGTLGGWNSYIGAINDQGWIVGTASVVNDSPAHAFRTTSSRAINAATDDLGTLGGTNSEARDVNASGQVVGNSQPAGNVGRHAYRTLPGGVITLASDLGTLGGRSSFALGVNDLGEVVGYSSLAVGSSTVHAFRTAANGTILPGESDLGTLGTGANSHAAEINNAGVVVGWSEFVAANTAVHAVVHHPGGEMLDLNTLISPTTPLPTGWTLAYAMGINSSGQIAGYALDPSGNQHGFLLTPIPEPATAGVMLLLPLLALPRRERR